MNRECFVMAEVYDTDGEVEAEPVTVRTTPHTAQLVLEDGTRLVFDRRELADAVGPDREPHLRRVA